MMARFLHKTRLCTYYANGYCARGEDCSFAHRSADVRTAPDFSYTQPCKSFMKTGKCMQGDACKFAHALGKMLPWKCSEAEHDDHGSRCNLEERTRECDQPRAVQRERQQRASCLSPWALDGRSVTAGPAPRLREVPALRGRELPSLKATVKRSFLHFFVAKEEARDIHCALHDCDIGFLDFFFLADFAYHDVLYTTAQSCLALTIATLTRGRTSTTTTGPSTTTTRSPPQRPSPPWCPRWLRTPAGSCHNKQWHQQQHQQRHQQHQGDTTGAPRTQWRARPTSSQPNATPFHLRPTL
ncbi:unnamed protein product [Prorocentrum cordatum]|uniref:C3H1-type domain-containing protein n=1 Tax=Prorocentrum cordatum TaxID=2364126 RepID=A0ABN9RKQ3_9DINO|nr:unnamed protein product [Polarella glacialis]